VIDGEINNNRRYRSRESRNDDPVVECVIGVFLLLVGVIVAGIGIGSYSPFDKPKPFRSQTLARAEDVRRRMGDETAERFLSNRRQGMERARRHAPAFVGVGGVILVAGIALVIAAVG
jgi:hypothetical protein